MEVITRYNYFKALKLKTPWYLSSRYALPQTNVSSCCRDKWSSQPTNTRYFGPSCERNQIIDSKGPQRHCVAGNSLSYTQQPSRIGNSADLNCLRADTKDAQPLKLKSPSHIGLCPQTQ